MGTRHCGSTLRFKALVLRLNLSTTSLHLHTQLSIAQSAHLIVFRRLSQMGHKFRVFRLNRIFLFADKFARLVDFAVTGHPPVDEDRRI